MFETFCHIRCVHGLLSVIHCLPVHELRPARTAGAITSPPLWVSAISVPEMSALFVNKADSLLASSRCHSINCMACTEMMQQRLLCANVNEKDCHTSKAATTTETRLRPMFISPFLRFRPKLIECLLHTTIATIFTLNKPCVFQCIQSFH